MSHILMGGETTLMEGETLNGLIRGWANLPHVRGRVQNKSHIDERRDFV